MMASQKEPFASSPVPVPFGSIIFTIRLAGPFANTVPTMMRRTTENTRMTFFITPPRYLPVTSEMEPPLFRSESIPEK